MTGKEVVILIAGTLFGGLIGVLVTVALVATHTVSGNNPLAGAGLGYGGVLAGFGAAFACIVIAAHRKENE